MGITVKELAQHLGGEWTGKGDTIIEGVASLEKAKEKELTFLADPKFFSLADKCQAGALVVGQKTELKNKTLIHVSNPALGFAKAVELILKPYDRPVLGVSEKAILGQKVEMGKDVSIYPGCVIGDEVKIGDRVRIYPGAYVGDHTAIGNDSIIYANVTIYEKTQIGSRVVIHSGTVIGADGYGYVQHNGIHHKFPQIGRVVIDDDVEVGANCCIDRGALGDTRVGKGTKIDNLIQIAHNVQIGQGCLLVSQCGISGSTKLGNYVVLGGQAGIPGHLELGDGVMVGAQAGVTKNASPGTILLGSPAYPIGESKRLFALMRSLPKLKSRIEELEKKLEALEKK